MSHLLYVWWISSNRSQSFFSVAFGYGSVYVVLLVRLLIIASLSLIVVYCSALGSGVFVNCERWCKMRAPDRHPLHSARCEDGMPKAGPMFSISIVPFDDPIVTPKLMVSPSNDDPSDTINSLSLSWLCSWWRYCMIAMGSW